MDSLLPNRMPNLRTIFNSPIKVIFAIHFVLVTWSIQGFWCPKSVLFYNLFFFICLLWDIEHVKSNDHLLFAVIINVLSIFFDIITLAIYFPTSYAIEILSAVFMVINVSIRVITSMYLLRLYEARESTNQNPSSSEGPKRRYYQEISDSDGP